MAREYDHLFKLLIIGDSGKYKHTEHHHTVREDAQLKKSPSVVLFFSLSSASSSLSSSPSLSSINFVPGNVRNCSEK